MRVSTMIAISTLFGLSAAVQTASAQEGEPWLARAEGNRVAMEMDWWPSENFHILSWDIVGQFRVAPTVYLDLEVPWAGVFGAERNTESKFVFGNPALGVHWADKVSPDVVVFAGGSIAISTLISGDRGEIDLDDYLFRLYASVNRAYLDLHRFLPEFVFLRPRGGAEIRLSPSFRYRGDLTPMIMIPVGEGADEVEVFIEHGSEFEGRSDGGVGGGLRLQAAWIATELDSDDVIQTAIEPYFIYDPVNGFNLRVGVLIPLDEEAGFAFDDGRLRTVRLSLGGRW